jgi:hypothetical protein
MGVLRNVARGRAAFVIGTGRSGTHWLGNSLGDHPEVRATVEAEPMFWMSTRMALDPTREKELFPKLVRAYRKELLRSGSRLYVDKTHPNIWHAEQLKRSFREALFVGIERDPYATVASMMVHEDVSEWHRRWREFPVPNRFLGITPELAAIYDDLPLPAQCARRWMAHHERMEQLRGTLGTALLVISYEEFARDTDVVVERLRTFLGVEAPLPVPEVKVESLAKWRDQLSDSDVRDIETVIGFPPE